MATYSPQDFFKGGIKSTVPKKKDFLEGAANAVNSIFPGKQIGESLGTIAAAGGRAIKGDKKGAQDILSTQVPVPNLIGDYLKAGSTVAGAAAPVAKTLLGSAAQFGALGGTGALGQGLTQGNSIEQNAGDTLKGALGGAALGGGFNLLGKAAGAVAKKAGAPILSFTSGVPKAAINEAAKNPTVSREGQNMGVEGIRKLASDTHGKLSQELGSEFEQGLSTIAEKESPVAAGMNVGKIQPVLNEYADQLAKKFNVSVTDSLEGPAIDFSKSAIVKSGEQGNIAEAINTLRTWNDYSPGGVQKLAERIGALRNFESGAQTKSSAILGKIYDKIAGEGGAGIIPKYYPELYGLRQTYSQHKKVLDEIGNVINVGKDKPTQIQASISRLSNLFKEDRETYVDVLKKLGDESGVDFLSLLSGTEFQKVLPSFIRGLGGGSAVGVGASVLNPYLLLLAPLFSPRVVGGITRNAGAIQEGAGAVTKSLASPTAQGLVPKQSE